MDDVSDDFYEDDEPISDILAAFEAGPHVVSTPPAHLPFGALFVSPVPTYVPALTFAQAASQQPVPVIRNPFARTA